LNDQSTHGASVLNPHEGILIFHNVCRPVVIDHDERINNDIFRQPAVSRCRRIDQNDVREIRRLHIADVPHFTGEIEEV
jgi:hypothetical protein